MRGFAPSLLWIGVLCLSVASPRPAEGNPLVNPGFETGDLTGWTLIDPTGGDSVQCVEDASPFFGGASEGSCAFQMNGGNLTPDAVLEQAFATVPGTTYSLSFDVGNYRQSGFGGVSSVLVELLDGAVLLTGFPVAAEDADAAGTPGDPMLPDDFAPFAVSFVATGSMTVLRITDQSTEAGEAFDTMLDNFAVQVVPEPGTLGLLALGLGTLATTARRRR